MYSNLSKLSLPTISEQLLVQLLPPKIKNQNLLINILESAYPFAENTVKRTARELPFMFVITGVRYYRVNLCMTNFSYKSVRYKRVFVYNRVRCNRVSLYA